jgi:large subunit ribosomal protein L23
MSNANIKAGNVLLRARITEKAAIGADRAGVYVFEVLPKATKKSIAASVKAVYKVTPVKVNITKIAPKAVFVRGKRGVKQGGKKAYVYLKKGDKIELL